MMDKLKRDLFEMLNNIHYLCGACDNKWISRWDEEMICPKCNASKYRIQWKNHLCWEWLYSGPY